MKSPKPAPQKPCTSHRDRIANINQLIEKYLDMFEGIGHYLGKYKIHLHDDSKLIFHVPWKCPTAMRLFSEELDKMVAIGIIVNWVSSLAYVQPSITVNGQKLQAVDKFMYLGNTLSEEVHIESAAGSLRPTSVSEDYVTLRMKGNQP